jgi:putative sterol carrier protein
MLQRTVARMDDRWVLRTLGTRPGLRAIFAGMRSRYVPEEAGGLDGAIAFELTRAGRETQTWSVVVTPADARIVRGAVPGPALTVVVSVADFVRLATGELDPVRLLLGGKMEVRGDFGLAMRLGPMFGRSGR